MDNPTKSAIGRSQRNNVWEPTRPLGIPALCVMHGESTAAVVFSPCHNAAIIIRRLFFLALRETYLLDRVHFAGIVDERQRSNSTGFGTVPKGLTL